MEGILRVSCNPASVIPTTCSNTTDVFEFIGVGSFRKETEKGAINSCNVDIIS